MIGYFKETNQSTEVNPQEPHTQKNQDTSSIPTNADLKVKMEEVFPERVDGEMEHPIPPKEVPAKVPEHNDNTITLDDGTKIELPKQPSPIEHNAAVSDAPASDNSGSENISIESINTSDATTQNTETDDKNSNSTFEKDGVAYKTDDNGNVYMTDGKLAPNSTYELNGSTYTTDDKGRITNCEAKPQRSPENPRDNDAQREAGGDDRKENDQGGHIVGRDLNGDGGGGNLVAMDSKINQSDYKRMENDVKTALDEGKDITTKTEIIYDDDSKRPDKITVAVTADGKDTVYKFNNNIDGSMKDEVPENGKEAVQAELDDTRGKIFSIKEEYDEDNNLSKTTVRITYTDEDGNARRTEVVIENHSGGEN